MNKDKIINIGKDQVIKVANKIGEYSDKYSDFKSDNPVIELAGDFVSVIKLVDKGIGWVCERKFKSFLKGLYYDRSSDEDLSKLIDYIKNEKRAEFISNTFDKVLRANSRIACCIMGLLVNEMIGNNREVEYEDLLLIQALVSLNDFEIKNFIKVCKLKELNKSRNLNPICSNELDEYRNNNSIEDYTWASLSKNWINSGIVESTLINSSLEDPGVDYNKEVGGNNIEIFINKIGMRLFKYGVKIVELLEQN